MVTHKNPFYQKAVLIILGLYFIIDILYIGQFIILPLLFSIIIAIVLSPSVRFFIRLGLHRVLAILIAILLLFAMSGGAIFFISNQLGEFSSSLPILYDKSQDLVHSTVQWISHTFNFETKNVQSFIDTTKISLIETSKNYLGKSFLFMGNTLTIIFLVPVYIFMVLYYQPLLLEFVRKVFTKKNETEVNDVLHSTKKIIQKYLIALLIENAIVATLNSLGLFLLGVDYAILFGVIGAILNLIPYIGGIIAVSLPMMYALAMLSPWTSLFVLMLYALIQFVDNNYIIPKLVGANVKINALVSIVVVITGGAMWGIPGMFLSIPLTAIIKVIFDHIPPLKPWGFLLGDTMP